MKKARPTKARRTAKQKASSIAWQSLERWLDYGGSVQDWKKMRLDRRLYSIAPGIRGVLDGLKGYDPPARRRAELLQIANHAVGTFNGDCVHRWDLTRVRVVCDWMLRCALPVWLDRLPTWCAVDVSRGGVEVHHVKSHAERLRALPSLQWSCVIADLMPGLSDIWVTLEDAVYHRGTAAERNVIRIAHVKTSEALEIVSRVLSRSLELELTEMKERDGWTCQMAMRVLRVGHAGEPDAAVAATVPQLIQLLLEVQPGDSQQSIADRCGKSVV